MPRLPDSPPLASQLAAIASDIKLSHSVFALPFAVLAMLLAAAWAGRWPGWDEVVLIVLCMVLARTVAMAVNRWADSKIDAENPRTAGRAIPAGRVSAGLMLNVAILCGLAFIAMTSGFWVLRDNFWPVVLAPAVLAFLAGYSWMKRVTWLCHVYLGVALAISPVAAAIAIEPGYLAQPTVWLLSLMVLTWVAGFDVIYALQDVAADRTQDLQSIPARLGVRQALWIARGLHLVSVLSLAGVAASSDALGLWFWLASGVTALLLVVEHVIVAGVEVRRIPVAFLTINGVISLLLAAAGVLDVMMK